MGCSSQPPALSFSPSSCYHSPILSDSGGTMKHIFKLLVWLPALLWCQVIWGFSAQTAAVSGDLSDRLLWRLMALVSPAFAGGDAETQNAVVELLSFFERKACIRRCSIPTRSRILTLPSKPLNRSVQGWPKLANNNASLGIVVVRKWHQTIQPQGLRGFGCLPGNEIGKFEHTRHTISSMFWVFRKP